MAGFLVHAFLLQLIGIAILAAASDTRALLSLKNGVGDPSRSLESWNASTPSCQWQGVLCSVHGRVASLSLQFLELPASLLASTIEELPRLRQLNVSASNFTEPLAGITLHSCSLESLNISRNSELRGSFPIEFLTRCSGLRRLDLSQNQISGSISGASFGDGRYESLQWLDLSGNDLAGAIPPELLTACTNLRELYLSYNSFSGAFPSLGFSNSIRKLKLAGNSFTAFEIRSGAACRKLVELDVSANNISGKLFVQPTPSCPKLKHLNISLNSFSGTPGDILGRQSLENDGFLPSLEVLDASYNGFAGEVLGIHQNLAFLNFSSNRFTTIRDSFCLEQSPPFKLTSLLLPNNKLGVRVLDSLANCTSLEMLDFSFNNATGEIPDRLCENHPQLQHLLAWVNKLQGIVPPALGNCTNLTIALLSYNNLHGAIPPDISRLQNLWWLSLSSNRLTGKIPPSLGELQTIVVLQLGNNSLEGGVPLELSKCKNLVMLDLSANQLTGTVPSRVGRDYTGEMVLGLAPVVASSLGNCKILEVQFSKCRGRDGLFALQGLRLEDLEQRVSELATECVWSMQYLPLFKVELTSLIVLTLSYNNLTGGIPGELSSMQNLYKLDLAHNFLAGPIPESVGLYGFPLSNIRPQDSPALSVEEHHSDDGYREELLAGVPCFIISFLVATTATILLTRARQVQKVLGLRR
ncbi:hypothetical protein SELMODRAFT_421160 [Selaginella moellendorffii]|uniref:Leucine-rich repeat-containing N-terminal plant-type domain-containing protein n=1 Tax=Selaginella moellendorffii TaxID=88036 RepID=D8SE70_SELML|nr:hypothetical protein SELMODRAFT_421160 [Selaginella moellendorffii]